MPIMSLKMTHCYPKSHNIVCYYIACHHAESCYADCHYSECHCAECHYAECHSVKCHGAILAETSFLLNTVKRVLVHLVNLMFFQTFIFDGLLSLWASWIMTLHILMKQQVDE